MNMKRYEALCFGAICADLRILLPRFPTPGEGVRVLEARWTPGGNSLNEATALVGWGVRTALVGDALGFDPPGEMLAEAMNRLGLDAYLCRDAAARTVVCHVLITPDGQRTILAMRFAGPAPELPSPELIAACRVVSVTRYGPRSAEVAALARAAGATVVAGDATRPDDELTRYADVIVTSAELLADHNAGTPRGELMAELHAVRGATVVVTDGPRPAHVLWGAGGRPQLAETMPPAVVAQDTTGAGDVFRAAIVRGVLQDAPWPQILEQACSAASAAIAATSRSS